LILSAQWAEFIANDREKMAELSSWQQIGYEIVPIITGLFSKLIPKSYSPPGYPHKNLSVINTC